MGRSEDKSRWEKRREERRGEERRREGDRRKVIKDGRKESTQQEQEKKIIRE